VGVPDPSAGVRVLGHRCRAFPSRGHVVTPDPSPSGKRVRDRWSGEMESDPRGPAAQLLRRRRSAFSRAGSLPSNEAEARGAVEGFGGEPSREAEITPRVRGGCGRAALRTWAACWASLSPFLSSRLEGGCRPSWAWLPSMCLRFKAVLVP